MCIMMNIVRLQEFERHSQSHTTHVAHKGIHVCELSAVTIIVTPPSVRVRAPRHPTRHTVPRSAHGPNDKLQSPPRPIAIRMVSAGGTRVIGVFRSVYISPPLRDHGHDSWASAPRRADAPARRSAGQVAPRLVLSPRVRLRLGPRLRTVY